MMFFNSKRIVGDVGGNFFFRRVVDLTEENLT
jgi:hypothetical protein